ncbi:hypothetical protein C4D60_Mb05t25160 [Musa balbisiana]|uniref:Uncharacterized protein n=1 Tax=Musa balbisiana TaxID=52838 RepID=A0A4S8JYR5_MUSBA|nr:hypothetical protein C4D60_Mb05t25160 [Musa balbisiana]
MEGRNLSGFLIGCLGTAVTLGAYSQTLVSSTQCIALGLLILMFGLFVKEGQKDVKAILVTSCGKNCKNFCRPFQNNQTVNAFI